MPTPTRRNRSAAGGGSWRGLPQAWYRPPPAAGAAWPINFVAGEWDNESDENVIESIALTHDLFELAQ